MIEFAIGADVAEAFRAAVLASPETEWKPLIRRVDGKSYVTDQEWAEVVYVPNWAGHSRQRRLPLPGDARRCATETGGRAGVAVSRPRSPASACTSCLAW